MGLRRRDLLLAAYQGQRWFSDATAHVFGGVASFRDQLRFGIPYWRSVMDVTCGTDVYGSQGIAVGDIDNDGRDEVYVCQSGGLPNRLYKFGPDGRATDITERAGVGILDDTASALFFDTRNRGLEDLVVLRPGGPLLFLNRGDGTFELDEKAFQFARAPQGSFTGMAAADYDGDGLVDLYLCSYIYYQGQEQYRYPSPYHDARNGPPNFLFRNTGRGFTDVTRDVGLDENNDRYSFAAAWCDADGDGRPELYVANDFGRNNYYRWDGKRFRDVAAEAGVDDVGPGMSAAWFDFDGDGRFDLYVSNMHSEPGQRIVRERKLEPADAYRRHAKGNSLYRNLGNGKFEEMRQAEMGRWAWSADACDFDHDGAPEIYVTSGMITGDLPRDRHEFFWEKVVSQTGAAYETGWNEINNAIREGENWCGGERNVFYSRAGSRYGDASTQSGIDFADDSRAFAITDFDGDGHPDILLKSRRGPQVRALRNERGAARPSMAITLAGGGIGAVIRAGRQMQHVTAGSGYLSQHSKTIWFAPASTIEIRWPSGRSQRVEGLTAGARYVIREGETKFQSIPFARRVAWPAGTVEAVNTPVQQSMRLLEPLAFPEVLRRDDEKQILSKYLRDWRQPVPAKAIFHANSAGELTDIQIGPRRAASALPFGGRYVVPPRRNLMKLGAAFWLENRPDAALLYLDDALNQQPTVEAANGVGLMFARQGRFEEARNWLQKAITIDRSHAGAINNLGVLYGEHRKFDDAIAAFEYGISVAPEDETLYLNLGRIYLQQGRRDRARSVMERLLEKKPESRVARRALEELR
ncbi:MAG: tetratricopeptide repeat protein [Acidobacteria bacterium]|nr:tetratricopeptide repeat protein [Acidobacteriota bacterium]